MVAAISDGKPLGQVKSNHTGSSLVLLPCCIFVPTLPIDSIPVPFPTHFCPESFPLRIYCESTGIKS
jgi:hypothetical protein